MYDKEKAKDYYQKNKAYILQVHQAWAKKNVDQGGSVWRKYGRWSRIRNPNIDKEYYARHREEILYKKKIYYRKKKGLMYKVWPHTTPESLSGVVFKCFTHEQVKEINKKIRNNVLKKEEPSENSAHVSKIGKFSIVPCLPLMDLLHPWLYQCQEMNRKYFGYNIYWYFHLDSLNYNVYGTNGKYDWHMDANKEGTRTDIKLTCLLNLSEETYEGGEFNSINQLGKTEFNSGMGLIINSLVAHKITPVTKGERITLTYWATGPLWR